jgi:CheY-like chemotaxis protein
VPEFSITREISSVLAIARNITQQHKQQQELLHAKDKAEESDRLKTSFLANMSHEIRTPMNAILGFSSLLENPDLQQERKSRYIKIIKERSDDLLHIISDILDISAIEAGKIELEFKHVKVGDLLKEQHQLYQEKIALTDKELLFSLAIPNDLQDIAVKTDAFRLKQIISNLIDNAIKFTHKGSIEISMNVVKNKLHINVKDSGIGIPEDKFDVVFDRFRQLEETTTRLYGGNGLGLAICKSFAEALKGKIQVESVLGEGSTFTISLPYYNDNEFEAEQELNPNEMHWEKHHVLLVEDDIISAEYLKELMRKTGLNLHHAENGRRAIDIFNNNPEISLVLMDIQLPDINGLEVTKILKSTGRKITVIAQTAFVLTEDRNKLLAGGCDDFLSKPIKTNALLHKLNQYL